jgi:hypothetical protein
MVEQKVYANLDTPENGNHSNWVLDTGTTNHMTDCLEARPSSVCHSEVLRWFHHQHRRAHVHRSLLHEWRTSHPHEILLYPAVEGEYCQSWTA